MDGLYPTSIKDEVGFGEFLNDLWPRSLKQISASDGILCCPSLSKRKRVHKIPGSREP